MLIKRIRGLFAWAVIGLLIGLGVAALAGKAHAATTTQVSINSTTFTDLGAAPVMVQTLNYPVQIVVSDSLPSPSTTNVGYALYNGQPVTIPAADSSSHVYAAMIGGNATTLVVTAVEAVVVIAPAPSPSASIGIAPVVAGSAVSSSVLKASGGNLYGAYATCTSACWLMIFNATSLPANGATTAGIASGNLQDCIPVAAGGFVSINYNPGPPEVFSTGITAAISSTACGTLTASTVGFIHGSIQ